MTPSSEDPAADALSPPSGIHIEYPPALPISARVEDIKNALKAHQVVIVAGATGSGKTTQLPKIALELAMLPSGEGRTGAPTAAGQPAPKARAGGQLIGVTQPRRIAATSVAKRVAEELQCPLGGAVGYQIRFENRTGHDTRLKFMTDGILLAEIQGDSLLRRYHTLIIDEAHERGLTIDFLLGWLKRVLPKRPELKVIISSATIETGRFSEFFGGAPVIQVEGRTFPVDVLYEPAAADSDLAEMTADAVENIASLDPDGDFLVFLPGEREIRDTERALESRNIRGTEVLPLFARLSAAEQNRVFSQQSKRRVILATNVAETSLTLPGIVYVVDTGLARLSRYEPRSGITRLPIERISRASADQRKGRAGRVRDGICVRLYSEEDFDARPGFTDPELRRVGLAGVILRMKALGLGDVESFPFLDAPDTHAVTEGYRTLTELGALDKRRELTLLGRQLSRFPVDPRVGRMILAGAEYGVLDDVLVLAAALEVQDPRERPRGLEAKADQAHRAFREETSDFLGLLKLWAFVSDAGRKGSGVLRRSCKERFLSERRVREWREVYRQLASSVKELKLANAPSPSLPFDQPARVHCALLSGLLSRIGQYDAEKRAYAGARQTRFLLHPSSSLARKPPAWVMAFELVQTTQLFARTAAKIEPDWLSAVADHLLKRTYSEPQWSEKSARAVVKEHATLFGLPVLRDRRLDYSTIEPARARLIFLEHALVRGEYKSPGAFQEKNQELMLFVSQLRDKARRSDMLSDEEARLTFFDRRVPEGVVNGKTFEAFRQVVEASEPTHLHLALSDVLQKDEPLDPADYPDELELHGARLPLSYRFDPSADDDGVTLTVPLAMVSRIDPSVLDWTIPAWHGKKLWELLQRVPKATRRELGDVETLAARLAGLVKPFAEPLVPCLTRAVLELTGVRLPPDSIRPDLLPGHLRLTCRVLADDGHVLGEGRELAALFEEHGARSKQAFARVQSASAWRRQGLKDWDWDDLPEAVEGQVAGNPVQLYPALVDRGESVELTLMNSLVDARKATIGGVRRLLSLSSPRPLAALRKAVPKGLDVWTADAGPLGPSRAASVSFQERIVDRALAHAFDLTELSLPRSRQEFEAIRQAGTPRLESALATVLHVVNSVNTELVQTQRDLKLADRQRSGAAAIADIKQQLAALFPDDVLAQNELSQLACFPRYLQGMRLRLTRALNGPAKDAAKLEPLTPLLRAFEARRGRLGQRDHDTLRWAFEEARIAIFAPELKPAYPITIDKLAAMLRALG